MSTEYDILFLAIGDAVTIKSLGHLSISVQKFKDRLDSNGLCIAPVPPAGGEPEVERFDAVEKYYDAYGLKIREVICVTADDFDSHVTRLQADVEASRIAATISQNTCSGLIEQNAALQAEVESERTLRRKHAARIHELSDEVKDLQSELTKARECIAHVLGLLRADKSSHAQYVIARYQQSHALARQFSPAEKHCGACPGCTEGCKLDREG